MLVCVLVLQTCYSYSSPRLSYQMYHCYRVYICMCILTTSQKMTSINQCNKNATPPSSPSIRDDDDAPPEYMVLDHSLPHALSQALAEVYNGNGH